jgi:hypothetical protein
MVGVVTRRNRHYIHVIGPDSRQYTLPIEWTDLQPSPSVPVIDGCRVRLAPKHLLQVARFVGDRIASDSKGKKLDMYSGKTLDKANYAKESSGNVRQTPESLSQANLVPKRRVGAKSSLLELSDGENAGSTSREVGDDDSTDATDSHKRGRQ